MPLLTIKTRLQSINQSLVVDYSSTLMDILQRQGWSGIGDCGGLGICGRCKVLASGNISELTDFEREHLSAAEVQQGWRLACYTKVYGDSKVEVVEDSGWQTGSSAVGMPANAEYLAIDLGSTNIVMAAINQSGNISAQLEFDNPQRIYGSDVLARLSYALKNRENRDILRRLVVNSLNRQLETLNISSVKAVAMVGNPAMVHLLLGAEVSGLSVYPYQGIINDSLELRAQEVGLDLSGNPPIYIPPPAGLYVGSDAMAGLVSLLPDDDFILVDLGTNAEIIAKSQDRYLAVSAAAGPAFEGASIYQGMRALPGAITGIEIVDGRIQLQVISGHKPRGISGSGLVSIIGCLREYQAVNGDGIINAVPPPPFTVRDGSQGREIVIYTDNDQSVVLTQEDIRQFQLAKSAVRVAIDTVMAQFSATKWQALYLSGALGTNLPVRHLIQLGILPAVSEIPVIATGNTALKGAVRAAYDHDFRRQLEQIAKRIQVLELANQPEFQKEFIKNLSL